MREVRIKDTLSGASRALEPAGGEVGIYACGPTVYSRIHVGNARPYVVFMLLRRFLAQQGYAPRLVINVTDVNDKIYAAAVEAGLPSAEHAAEMTRLYVADTDALGLGRPDAEPLATEAIAEIIELIEALVVGGHAYESEGDVYFRVRSFEGYGKLSNRDPAEMDQGEETGTERLKEDPLDFALWKARKPDEDTAWPSPWGEGRPGWHIECSAMAEAELGPSFAIHGGGSDLLFPHHENELAQSRGAGRPFASIWMHNGMVLTGPEAKMAKSEGDIFLLGEAVDRFGREAVIGFLISGHYRQPLGFGTDALEQAAARNERVRDFFRDAERADGDLDPVVITLREAFFEALADDFNTPRATAELYDLVSEGHKREPLRGAHAALEEMLEVLGLETLAGAGEEADPKAVGLAAERERAREAGDFARADRIRDQLAERGYEVRDTAAGPRLVRRR